MGDTKRQYDSGERRFKHKGKKPYPYFENGVGKCPCNLSVERRDAMLNRGIANVCDPSYDEHFPKILYAVDESGAIYKAQTTEAGKSYHGYPYKGRLTKGIRVRLEQQAKELGCLEPFKEWEKKYVSR